jgi:hypothetical protein
MAGRNGLVGGVVVGVIWLCGLVVWFDGVVWWCGLVVCFVGVVW